MIKSTTLFNAFRVSFSTMVMVSVRTEGHLVNYSPSRHHPLPTGRLIPTVLDVCYAPPPPRGGELGRGDEFAIMVVDTVGALRRATDAAWGWIREHMELLGSGLARLLSHDQLLGSYGPADSRTLLQVDTAAEAVMTICPSVVVVLPMEDLAVIMAWIAFSGAVRGLGTDMSNGGGAPGGTLGVGRFEFDDASPQFPATSDVLRGDSSIASPALAAATI